MTGACVSVSVLLQHMAHPVSLTAPGSATTRRVPAGQGCRSGGMPAPIPIVDQALSSFSAPMLCFHHIYQDMPSLNTIWIFCQASRQ